MFTDKTWLVECPKSNDGLHTNGPSGWSLSPDELERIETDYFAEKLRCRSCGNSFNLWQGVRAFYVSDDLFSADFFMYNTRERAVVDIEVGKAVRVSFGESFEDSPSVYVTPQFDVYAAPTQIGKQGFTLLSCLGSKREIKGKVNWFASGNRGNEVVPLWRGLLSNAKRHQCASDYRSEIVELESAFEVFVGEYLSSRLNGKLRRVTLDWIFKHGVEEQLRACFCEITGKPLSKLFRKEYGEWKRHVKDKRNGIVHQGLKVTKLEAENARKATFDILTRIDNSVLEHFQVSLNFQ